MESICILVEYCVISISEAKYFLLLLNMSDATISLSKKKVYGEVSHLLISTNTINNKSGILIKPIHVTFKLYYYEKTSGY